MSRAITVEAEYIQAYRIDLSHLDIDYDDIDHHWCKWGTLYLQMKDGTTHEIDNGDHAEVDYKWPEELRFFDKDMNDDHKLKDKALKNIKL